MDKQMKVLNEEIATIDRMIEDQKRDARSPRLAESANQQVKQLLVIRGELVVKQVELLRKR